MPVYNNLTRNSGLASVEFTPVSDGNFTFFYLKSAADREMAKQWITSKEVGQEIIAETKVGDRYALVTHGDKKEREMIAALETQGTKLALHHEQKGFNPWAVRGALGFIGQTLQMAASFMRPDRKLDWSLFMFAAPNLIANVMAMTMGAQKSEDTNRLRFLKEQFNDQLTDFMPDGGILPMLDDDRAGFRKEPDQKTLLNRTKDFITRYSVQIGEVGLRYWGAFNLAFGPDNQKSAFSLLKSGDPVGAYKAGRTVGKLNGSLLTHYGGLLSMAGKTTAFMSKTEDMYDNKPKGWIDWVREKVTFRAGGWMEAVAFSMVATDAFKNKRISFKPAYENVIQDNKIVPQRIDSVKVMPDFVSGIGGILFTTGYIIRHWAKFGVKQLDMEEFYAHVTDSLAKMPPEKLPQLIADVAADVKEHFKDKPMDFGKVYTQLMEDLYAYHHIALDNLGTQPHERVAKLNGHAKTAEVPQLPLPQEQETKTKFAANAPKQPLDRVAVPAASHAEAAKTAGTTQPHLGV